MTRMAGKVALVTGAGRGQGRSHAVRLAEEGANIIAVDICAPIPEVPYPMATEEDLGATAAMVRQLGRTIVTAKVDVRDADALSEAVDSAVGTLGHLDVVVANAGIFIPGRFDAQTTAQWNVTLAVNVIGVRNTCLAALEHLKTTSRGSVILISSIAGIEAASGLSAYIASKHSIVGLTKALAVEWGAYNIRANAIAPGAVANTGMDTRSLASLTGKEATPFVTSLPSKFVLPRDTSNAVLYLASDESRYVTGTTLQVDAGMATI